MSEALDDCPESVQTDAQIRRASALFASYNIATGLNAKGEKAPGFMTTKRERQAAADRMRRAKEKAARGETLEEYRARRAALAMAREAKKREERGNACRHGHPLTSDNLTATGNGVFNCLACYRGRMDRSNARRRLAYALQAAA